MHRLVCMLFGLSLRRTHSTPAQHRRGRLQPKAQTLAVVRLATACGWQREPPGQRVSARSSCKAGGVPAATKTNPFATAEEKSGSRCKGDFVAPFRLAMEGWGRPSRVRAETQVTSQQTASPSRVAPYATKSIRWVDSGSGAPGQPLLGDDLVLWSDGLARRAPRPAPVAGSAGEQACARACGVVVAVGIESCAAAVTMCAASVRGDGQRQAQPPQGFEHAVGQQGSASLARTGTRPVCGTWPRLRTQHIRGVAGRSTFRQVQAGRPKIRGPACSPRHRWARGDAPEVERGFVALWHPQFVLLCA